MGQRYQMVILTRFLTLCAGDERCASHWQNRRQVESILHPEHIVTTMPHAEAQAWQTRPRKWTRSIGRPIDLVLLDINLTSHQPWLRV